MPEGYILCKIALTVESDGDSYYAKCIDFPGVFGCGDTEEDARNSAIEDVMSILRSEIEFEDNMGTKWIRQMQGL